MVQEETLHSLTVEELKRIEFLQQDTEKNAELTEVIYHQGFGTINDEVGTKGYGNFSGGAWTIVLVLDKEGNAVARGLSILSPRDVNRRIEGRVRARGRALRAIKSGKNTAPISVKYRTAAIKNEALLKAAKTYKFKSEFQPALRSYEQELVKVFIEKLQKGTLVE